MARPLRIEFAGAVYHICARGNARQQIFVGEPDRIRFVELLRQSSRRFEVAVIAFVLMGNHFHLIAQTNRTNLARWMQWLLASYTMFFNTRNHKCGHLFQGRYKSILVEKDEYLLGVTRYIHLNPARGVRLGAGNPIERRKRLREFKWSSYRGYAGLAKPFDFIKPALVYEELGALERGRAELEYRRFVEEGLVREIENPFEAVHWQTVLGSDGFVQNLRDRTHALLKGDREIPALRDLSRSPIAPETIIDKVASKHGLRREQLLGQRCHGMKARNLAMWLIWESGTKSLRQIGEMFGGIDYAAVSDRIRRIRAKHNRIETRRLFAEILNLET